MKKYMITFGNEKFKNSRERIVRECKELNIFNECKFYNENYVENLIKIVSNRVKNGRGFWWYMWKPFIIYNKLLELNENDILMYCDSGMKIFNNEDVKEKFKNIFSTLNNDTKSGIITFVTTGNPNERFEYMYNMNHIYKHFNITKDSHIINSQQIQAGIIFIKKNNSSLNITKQWYEKAINNPELFVGDNRFIINKIDTNNQHDKFRDHRHDQSIWSILCKLNNVNIFTHDKNPIHQTHYRE